ncbi:MAG: choice-of-anchor L domain-containing protein, partial [Bacteroidales bacterium]
SLVETIATGKTHDASTLSFRFNSFTDSIAFAFVFASDEYLEYVNEGVSDVFGFFCRKKGSSAWQNLATLPNSEVPITVDLINTKENSDYYLHNYYYNDVSARRRHHTAEEIERSWLLGFDGLTQGISTGMRVEPYSTYEFRITIADVGDNRFDSWVMLVGQSFKSSGKIVTPGLKELKSFLSIVDQDLAYTQSGDTLNVTSQLYFDFDSHTLQEASKSLLESLTKVMQFSHFELTILGYTDPSGSRDYNLQLSEKRAGSVAGFLEEAGISPNRLKAVGMGEYTLETDDAAARKVVFQLVPGK